MYIVVPHSVIDLAPGHITPLTPSSSARLSALQIQGQLQAFDQEVQQELQDGTVLEKIKGILSCFVSVSI